MAKDEWVEWIKCNILEIIILFLVLALVVKAYSIEIMPQGQEEVPTVEEAPQTEVQEAPLEETPYIETEVKESAEESASELEATEG